MSEINDLRGKIDQISTLVDFHEALIIQRDERHARVKSKIASSEKQIIKLSMEAKKLIKKVQSRQKI